MGMNEAEFLKRLLAAFKLEAEEHLQAMSSGLVLLESVPDDRGAIESLLREAHSLKGAARAVNRMEIARACHHLEDVFSGWKNGRITPTPPLFAVLHRVLDRLQQDMEAIDPASASVKVEPPTTDLVRDIDAALRSETRIDPPKEAGMGAAAPAAVPEIAANSLEGSAFAHSVERTSAIPLAAHRPETVRVQSARMDTILLQSEELIGVRLAAARHAADLDQLGTELRAWCRNVPGLDVASREDGLDLAHRLSALAHGANREQRGFTSMLNSLLSEVKQALMLPARTILEGLPKLVRELSRDQDKEVDLIIDGEHLEVDRRVLEDLKDPLIHIIRNAIDHGIESRDGRAANGKPRRGSIRVSAIQRPDQRFELRVRDDGRGFNTGALKAAAIRAGVLPSRTTQEPEAVDLAMLAFHSGISTSPLLTEVSGRGLGLAIVQDTVDRLGGTVSLSGEPGSGAEIRMVVPITLATFRGILVRSNGQPFLIPSRRVTTIMQLTPGAVESVEGKDVLRQNGTVYSMARLSDILALPERSPNAEPVQRPVALVVDVAGTKLALMVDDVRSEEEVLVKNLGKQLARVRHIGGAAILGSGALVPILYIPDVLKTAIKGNAPARGARTEPDPESAAAEERREWRILLAEDSITARTLLKTILESAGYTVLAVVDGAEALATLRTTAVDLIVSDVEMPRLNGFDLTRKVRADDKLREIPVVLITALESREDREHGIEAGANAYIVKSSFDQSNLLETVQRLI